MTVNHMVCAFLRRCIKQMKRMGMNQSALAKRMHVSRAYIGKLMSGDVNITFGTAMKLARALEMDFFPTLTPRSNSNTLNSQLKHSSTTLTPRVKTAAEKGSDA